MVFLRVGLAFCAVFSLPGPTEPPRLESETGRASALSASWLDAIRAKARSRPALLIWADGRLVAQASDGTELGSLAGVRTGTVAFDPRMQLVWMRQPDRLLVLDLRAREPRPEIIATHLAGPLDFEVNVSRRDGSFAAISRFDESRPRVVLEWSANPKLGRSVGKLANKRWLATNLDRELIGFAGVQGFAAEDGWGDDRANGLTPLDIPNRMRCEDRELCGRFQHFGNAGWLLVLVGNRYDRAPYNECMLFDPNRRKYATSLQSAIWGTFEETKPGSCGPYWFDRSTAWYFSAETLCKVGGACRGLTGRPLGWVDAGPAIGEID